MIENHRGVMNVREKERYLVFSRVSDLSLHKQWIVPEEYKNFDVFLEYYGNEPKKYYEDCEYYSQNQTGVKLTRFHQLLQEHGDMIFSYDAIMLVDDDVSMNSCTISKVFKMFTEYGLFLAQPALSWDSYFSHKITVQNPFFMLRFTNVIEGMAAIFSKEALKICYPTFEKCPTGWGLDVVWPKLLGNPIDKIAIIDAAPVRHTRAMGTGDLYKSIGIKDPMEQLRKTVKEYGAIWEFIQYGGILRGRLFSEKM